ncbi:LysR substrate-binding domain-containing protein [Brucella pituitosa]|uniref:LysR substrate-binding domain-containing protein n=1 Tax=Brucella pituitosa TaxID=571256 RepID=UPI003F4AF59D
MKVRQLEAFQAVVLTGSVTAAAARMNVSQPAVSQLLGQLERACKFKLFDRRGGKIHLTREAEILYAEVDRIFVNVDRIARVATAIQENSWGALRVAAFPAVARCLMPEIILEFQIDHVATRFHIQSMRSRTVVDAVAAQHVDIGVSSMAGDRPEVESILVHTMRAICILPAQHRLAQRSCVHARDLEGEAFISLGQQDGSKSTVDRVFDQLSVNRKILIESGQSETIYSFVAAGAGVSVVDPLCAYNQRDLRETQIAIRPFLPEVDFGLWIIKQKHHQNYRLLDEFERKTRETLSTKLSAIDADLLG